MDPLPTTTRLLLGAYMLLRFIVAGWRSAMVIWDDPTLRYGEMQQAKFTIELGMRAPGIPYFREL